MALALLVGGCATTEVAVAPEPAAAAAEAEVSAIAGAARTYPRFSDIPTLPEDTRPLAVWGQAAGEVLGSGSDLVRDTADETWTLKGTEAFASGARQDSGPAAPLVSATAAADPSFEPSSTIMISSGGNVCAKTLSIVRRTHDSLL